MVLGRDGHVVHANSSAERMLGTRLSGMRGRPFEVPVAIPVDGRIRRERCEFRRPDGQSLVLCLDAEPVLGADGEPFQIVVNLADVTADSSDDREFRAMFEGTAVGMLRLDLDGDITDANPAACRLLGCRPDQLIGRSVLGLFQPDDATSLRCSDLGEFELGILQADLRLANGMVGPRWVRTVISTAVDRDGKPAFLAMTLDDISAAKAREVELENRMLHDSLTGLPNRTLLEDRLRHAIQIGQRQSLGFALFLIDLNRFKEGNDSLAHPYGDALLAEAARRLSAELRASDTFARLGGGEFAALLPGVDSAELAAQAASKLLTALNRPFDMAGRPLEVTASLGAVLFPEHGQDPEALLRRAGVAMHVAKWSGGGHRLYSGEPDASGPRRLALMAELRRAMEQDQLVLHYQPRIDGASGEVLGVNALLRWVHPEHGLLTPDSFLPLAEQTSLIVPLERWVLSQAIQQCARWHERDLDLAVAVTASARSLHDRELPDFIAHTLSAAGVDASRLQLEIAESALMAAPALAAGLTARLMAMGVRTAIHDARLQTREIKIDESVVFQNGQHAAHGFRLGPTLTADEVFNLLTKSNEAEEEPCEDRTGAVDALRPAFTFDEVNRRLLILHQVSLFFGVPDEQLRALARRMRSLEVEAGGEIIGLEHGRDRLWVIEEGVCEVVTDDTNADPMPLLVLGKGDVCGTNMLNGEPRTGLRIVASRGCRLLGLDRSALLAVLPHDSSFFEQLRHVAQHRRDALTILDQRTRAGEDASSTVISVYSPKGGSGKSTIAVNLAATLARQHPGRVLLFDLSLPYNHAALLANTAPTSCLARASDVDEDVFPLLLRSALVRHPSGFAVLPTALRAEEADLISPDLVMRALHALARDFSHVVFDLGVALTDPALAVLELSHQVVVVTAPELASLKDAAQFLDILSHVLRLPAGRVHVVVNHRSGKANMDALQVEALLGRAVAVEFAFDGDRPERAAVAGKILAVDEARGLTARSAALLADRLEVQSRPAQPIPTQLPFVVTGRLVPSTLTAEPA